MSQRGCARTAIRSKGPANPLRGLADDVAALKDVLDQLDGPIILVGHSYGGAVITGAAAGDPDVKRPDLRDGVRAGRRRAPRCAAGPIPWRTPLPRLPLVAGAGPRGDGSQDVDLYIDQAKFRETFAADVTTRTAAQPWPPTQRPASQSAPSATPLRTQAWKSIPSWFLVAQAGPRDRTGDLQRFMAQRAKSHTEETNGSHAVLVSHPGVVADVIRTAATG